jgi:4-amino-4-deoxy-L-arabinose transferase-like glycosyltransferase
MISVSASSRREILAVLALTIAGAALRFHAFGGLGLTHFDEGVYALSGLWSVHPGGLSALDPTVVPYAPPAFPLLVGIVYLLVGVADVGAILASTLCGIATIPVAAWLGRRTFGAGAGAAAAALSALSMAHIAFSRKALTDAPFVLGWLLALALGSRFLERPGIGRALTMGAAVGLAQNLKYNGWLTGVLVILGALSALFPGFGPRAGLAERVRETRRAIVVGTVGIVMAGVVYFPWFEFVQRHGGYGSLVRHHQSYVGGFGAWPSYWNQQVGQVVALSGGPVVCGFAGAIAMLAAAWVRAGERAKPSGERHLRLVHGALIVGGGFALASIPTLPWWLGLPVVPWLLTEGRPAVRFLGAWWLVLSVMTPLYHPYARLWLPLHAAGWMLVAGLVIEVLDRASSPRSAHEIGKGEATPAVFLRGRGTPLAVAIGLALVHLLVASPRALPFGDLFRPTSALRDVVALVPRTVPAEAAGHGISVLGRRPLAFYLLLQGRIAFGLVGGPDDLARAASGPGWSLIDGLLVDPPTRGRLAKAGVGVEFPERLDPVTLLDVAPEAAFKPSASRTVRLWVVPNDAVRQALEGDPPEARARAEPR